MDVLLVGYGTLLLKGSLGHTIGSTSAREKPATPVVVPDHRRLFNLRPTHYESSHKLTERSIENAAMNVEPTKGVHFNALAFPVTEEEIGAIDERERYYERRRLRLLRFDSGKDFGEGFCYVADPDSDWIERDPEKLLPLWRDIVWARAGAYGIGERFGVEYDRTTYLADGKTLMVERYRQHLDDASDVEIPT